MDPKTETEKKDGEVQATTEPVAPPEVTEVPSSSENVTSDVTPAPQIPSHPEPSETPPTSVGYTETESSKLIYILVGVLVVILLSLVGLFFYKQTTSIPSTQPTPTPGLDVEETAVTSPKVAPAAGDEAELQQIEIPDIDDELKEIENDLNQL